MDRDQTLPDWIDLLQLLLKYFLDTSLNSRRGKGFFFFFGGFDLVNLAQQPFKVRQVDLVAQQGAPGSQATPKAYKSRRLLIFYHISHFT